MARRSIVLEERKQIKIFTNPVRQEMIRLLRLSEVPLTAKDLADRLYLSPAAVQHHLKKLEEIGVVEVDHHARAGDMEVTYYRDADGEVQLQMGRNDGFQGEREALAANLVDGAFRRFLAAAQQHNENEISEYGAMLSGVLHLSPEDRRILMEQVGQFLRSHDTAKAENLEHWEYVILAYRA